MQPNGPPNPNNPYPQDEPAPPPANRGVPVGQLYPDVGHLPSQKAASGPQSTDKAPVGPPPEEQPKGWWAKHRGTISTVALLLLAPLIAWAISSYALQSYQVNGESMEHTLQNQDRLIVNKFHRSWARLTHHQYVPHRGDIVIIDNKADSDQIIKRVIGLPGERVVVKDNEVTIYNDQNPKGFNPDKTGKYQVVQGVVGENVDITLGSDEIFVCGDNRPNSKDSRYFGPFKLDDVVGKVVLRIMPFNKTGTY